MTDFPDFPDWSSLAPLKGGAGELLPGSQSGEVKSSTRAPRWVMTRLYGQGLPPLGARASSRRWSELATPRWCQCREPILVGVAWPETVELDPWPTTIDGELFAILAGRRTVELDLGRRLALRSARYLGQLYQSADEVRVLVEHSCSGPWPPVSIRWEPPKPPANPPY